MHDTYMYILDSCSLREVYNYLKNISRSNFNVLSEGPLHVGNLGVATNKQCLVIVAI
jgi:hypothetical protein